MEKIATDASLTFNDLLRKGGYPLESVRLLRHQEPGAAKGRSVYELWRDDRAAFELYQSQHNSNAHRSLVNSTHWASFVGTPWGETMFTGFYRAQYIGPTAADTPSPTTSAVWLAGTLNLYEVVLEQFLGEYSGRLFIDWGASKRSWFQRADRQEKPIIEIRKAIVDPPFPGYLNFIENFSRIAVLPQTWIELLRAAKGVYVLTCPRNKELYIGSAYGDSGFYGRWAEEARDGHGGNLQLKNREHSDFQVSILEVAGSSLSDSEIIQLESHWKTKLQTREMGLNSN